MEPWGPCMARGRRDQGAAEAWKAGTDTSALACGARW